MYNKNRSARAKQKSTLKSKQQNPLENKPNGDFLEIEKYQKVNQKRLKN